MTLYQFNALNEKAQAETLWENGVHISERDEGVYRFILYQIDSFYVEVWYHREQNAIRKFKTFISTNEPLSPYLDKINLLDIFKG